MLDMEAATLYGSLQSRPNDSSVSYMEGDTMPDDTMPDDTIPTPGTSLLSALLQLPRNSAIQARNERNRWDEFDAWRRGGPGSGAVIPERRELMMRLLYDVLHHSIMMGDEADTFGTMLAKILMGDNTQVDSKGHSLQDNVSEIRAHMKKAIETHLNTLLSLSRTSSV
jgi:hypothetical protein